jgi:hydroxypyruvate isomerase
MPKFSANLSTLFKEVDFLDRFERAARAGFKAVECQFPYEWDKASLRAKLDAHHVELVLFNLPPGNWGKGDRGIACLPGREKDFRESVGEAVEYAKALGCKRLNCLAGITPAGAPEQTVRRTLVENLRYAAEALEKAGISLLVEAINTWDMPGFYVSRTRDALKLFEEAGHRNLWLQYDIYHMQVMEGNLTRTIRKTCRTLLTCSSPTIQGGTNPAPARSTSPTFSRPSTTPATRAGSAVSTTPPASLKTAWRGSPLTCRKEANSGKPGFHRPGADGHTDVQAPAAGGTFRLRL